MEWFVNENGGWVKMPTPSEYSIDTNDLDVDTYRSVVNGALHRNRLGTWHTISFSFNFRYENEVKAFLAHIADKWPLTIRAVSPIFSTSSGSIDLVGYVGKIHADYQRVKDGYGYTVSFNFVEARK